MARTPINGLQNEATELKNSDYMILDQKNQDNTFTTKKISVETLKDFIGTTGTSTPNGTSTIAMPNWGTPKDSFTIGVPSEEDGFLYFMCGTYGQRFVKLSINDNEVYLFGQNEKIYTLDTGNKVFGRHYHNDSTIIPISAGDVVRFEPGSSHENSKDINWNWYDNPTNPWSDYTNPNGQITNGWRSGDQEDEITQESDSYIYCDWKFYPIKGSPSNGSIGGVLDGTILKEPTVVSGVSLSKDTATEVYTTTYDCGLYMEDECDSSETAPNRHSDIECNYWFDAEMTKPLYKHNQADATVSLDGDGKPQYLYEDGVNPEHVMGYQGTTIPIKKGTTIYASANWYTSERGSKHKFRFIEYKLNSLATKIGMPDYENTVDLELALFKQGGAKFDQIGIGTENQITFTDKSPIEGYVMDTYTVPKDGFLKMLYRIQPYDINKKSHGKMSLYYKRDDGNGDVSLIHWDTNTEHGSGMLCEDRMIPVSKGDKLYIGINGGDKNENVILGYLNRTYFIPLKSSLTMPATCSSYVVDRRQQGPDENGSYSYYTLYNDGWIEQGGYVAKGLMITDNTLEPSILVTMPHEMRNSIYFCKANGAATNGNLTSYPVGPNYIAFPGTSTQVRITLDQPMNVLLGTNNTPQTENTIEMNKDIPFWWEVKGYASTTTENPGI